MAGPKEQPLPPDVIGRDDATEVLRAFVVDGGLSIAFTRAFEEPDMWGLLLVDIARHAARAYARESAYTEDEALSAHRRHVRSRNRAADRHGQHHAAVATRSLTMPINILMPALSPTMEKGNLAKWLKKEGDKVKSGDVIAEIETDKATMEVEAVDEGTIAKIVVPEGTQDVPVNDVIAVLAGDGEDVKAAGAGAASAAQGCRRSRRSAGRCEACAGSRHRLRRLRRRPRHLPPRPPRPQAAASAPQTNGHARIFSSPLARRLAKEAGIELARITGSGPHGRVIARDVEEAKSGKGLKAPAAAPAGAPRIAPSMSDKQILALFEAGQLRGRPARRHAPHHRAAADRVGADRSAFLSDDRLRHRQAARRARGDQRRGAEGQGEEAALQALGQRLRHQGDGDRAAADSRTPM